MTQQTILRQTVPQIGKTAGSQESSGWQAGSCARLCGCPQK
jgi:hypothetical protein